MAEKPSGQGSEVRSFEEQVEITTKGAKHVHGEQAHNEVISGDDSDGKLNWTFRSFVAYVSLCFVYTGMSHQQSMYACVNHLDRFSDAALLQCRRSELHCC